MDEDKNDINNMSDDQIKEIIPMLDDIITRSQSSLETIEGIEHKEIYEIANKGLTWLFAISVGTLLWILGNFDKFTIADGSMPYKGVYILSIVFVGLSSVRLTWLQAKLFMNQFNNTINYNTYRVNHIKFLRHIQLLRQKIDLLEKGVFQPINTLSVDMDKIGDGQIELNKSVDKFKKMNKHIINNPNLLDNLMRPIISYILGIICISVYIIIFMICYV